MTGTPLYLGIDPGAGGGLAAIDRTGNGVECHAMPATERDLFALLEHLVAATLDEQQQPHVRAVLEHVWSSPQMGVASAFKFGTNVGSLRMALVAAGIPFELVTPQKWQKALGCQVGRSRASGTGGDKNITKRKAQELFPFVQVKHAIADALLIAEFCRRSEVRDV